MPSGTMLRTPVASLAALCVVASLAAPGWAIPPDAPICGPVWCRYWLHSQEPAPDGVDAFGGGADLVLDLSEVGGEVDLVLDLSVVTLWEPANDPGLGPDDLAQEPDEGAFLSPMPRPLPLTTGSASQLVAFIPEPSTAALTATGLLGLLAYARRRKRGVARAPRRKSTSRDL